MNINASGENEAPDKGKEVEHGVLGEKQSSFPGRELRVDTADEFVVRAGSAKGLQGPSSLQIQQQPQATVVCWARFLHLESIRVLLVENDDSTRHVVTALLRNCNYEVLEAANGLQAWKILEDLSNRIDLVLTEVVMPYLPGIPLLSKIMSHKTRKNVPVIMMSSHDSMGLVFKCLSKGAVDFLVKPIRKNELKNLWQHVWRRCHSSSGSGSESGTQTHKSVKSKLSEKSDNSGSDDGENDMSNGLNVGDGSDDGSGTRSSWTKQAVEVDSSQALSPVDQVAECQDSTCAQVIHSNAKNSGYKRVHIRVAREGHEQKPDIKDLESEPKSKNPMEIPVEPSLEFECEALVKQSDMGQEKLIAECSFRKHKDVDDEISSPLIDGRESASTREVVNILDNCNKEPNLELSLKRLWGAQDTEISIQEERFVLRRSEQSAFSRYNTSSNTFKAPNRNTGSSSMMDNCTEVATKLESGRGIRAHSADHPVYFSSNGVSNNLDMGSTTNKLTKHPSSMKDESETTSAINGLQPSAFRPIRNDLRYDPPQVLHPHHHFHQNHHSHCFHNLEQQPSSNHEESSSKKLAVDLPHCGSENVVCEAMECNLKDYSLNRSASGSNHVSNVQNGSSKAVNAVGTNGESDAGQAGKSGSGDASGSGSGSGSGNKIDEDKIARRIAALSKFRQKKKDRCFTKKVRYHNRKKLAEQRPRVRGQFVKQSGTDSSNKNYDE